MNYAQNFPNGFWTNAAVSTDCPEEPTLGSPLFPRPFNYYLTFSSLNCSSFFLV